MSPYHICIVDDDESVRMALDGLVRSMGHCADTFGSATEFLASQALHTCDCLILDVQMPGLSGLELQQQLLTLGVCLPLIFITAFPKARWREQALAAGALEFLGKPFDGRTLVSLIERAGRLGRGR